MSRGDWMRMSTRERLNKAALAWCPFCKSEAGQTCRSVRTLSPSKLMPPQRVTQALREVEAA